MKTSLVIASVLLAGVALEAAAYRINNNNENQGVSKTQWQSGNQQRNANAGSFNVDDELHYNDNDDTEQYSQNDQKWNMDNNRDQYNQNNQQWKLNNNNRDEYNQDNQQLNYNNKNRDQSNQQLNYNNKNRDQNSQQLNYNNKNRDQKNNDYESRIASRDNGQNYEAVDGQQYQNQNRADLTQKMIEKIAALQKIARDNNIAERTQYFTNALALNANVVKMSEHDFVNFYNTTIKNLDDGELEYLYLNPERDTVLAQYLFNRIDIDGSYKSNVHEASAGHFAIAMNKVNSNVSTGFENDQHAVIRPAQYQYADAIVKTNNGVETQKLDEAVARNLRSLETALTAEVSTSANRMGLIAKLKNEIRKPVLNKIINNNNNNKYNNNNNNNNNDNNDNDNNRAANKGKLFDMRWQEDDVSMEMANIGFKNNLETIAEPLKFVSASFYRKSADLYRMRYHFTVNDLEWTSPLKMQSANKRIEFRSANIKIQEIDVYVTVAKSLGSQQQQQSCGKVNANVEVTGLRYNMNENVPSEFMSKIDNKFQRFIEHSLENYVQESLKQVLCNNSNNNNNNNKY